MICVQHVIISDKTISRKHHTHLVHLSIFLLRKNFYYQWIKSASSEQISGKPISNQIFGIVLFVSSRRESAIGVIIQIMSKTSIPWFHFDDYFIHYFFIFSENSLSGCRLCPQVTFSFSTGQIFDSIFMYRQFKEMIFLFFNIFSSININIKNYSSNVITFRLVTEF